MKNRYIELFNKIQKDNTPVMDIDTLVKDYKIVNIKTLKNSLLMTQVGYKNFRDEVISSDIEDVKNEKENYNQALLDIISYIDVLMMTSDINNTKMSKLSDLVAIKNSIDTKIDSTLGGCLFLALYIINDDIAIAESNTSNISDKRSIVEIIDNYCGINPLRSADEYKSYLESVKDDLLEKYNKGILTREMISELAYNDKRNELRDKFNNSLQKFAFIINEVMR